VTVYATAERLDALMPAWSARIPIRAIGLVASVILAYNYSLSTLLRGLTLQTPVAYLALVPPIALLLGAANFRLQPNLRPIHDRQLDWIIGFLLVAIAGVVSILLPSAYSADFWMNRLDMLGLPFFAAGLIAILYGVRRLWAMKWAVLFLLLAWPDPYVSLLASAIGTSTDVALFFVDASLRVLPVAQPLGQGSFLVSHAGTQFSLAVGSACSGINSMVGFMILGAALNTLFRGRLWRRLAWLMAGLLLVGLLNVLRIDLIFVAGWAFGESFAIDVLHPVGGVIVFGVGATAMFVIAPAFGLRIPRPPRDEAVSPDAATALSGPAAPRLAMLPLHRPMYPVAVGLLLGAMLAFPNASFAHYDSVADAFGSPTLGAVDPASIVVPGWQGSSPIGFDQATQYFGANGTWERVAFTAESAAAAGPGTFYLDVIRTDDSGSLAAYGVQACYDFHGYSQVSSLTADVGAGVAARIASFRSPIGGTDWTVLWWEWPFNAGGQARYERLVLLAPLNPGGLSGATTTDAAFSSAQSVLTQLARQVVAQAVSYVAPTAIPATQE
jgi:exosortase